MSVLELIGRGWQFPPRFKQPEGGPVMLEGEALIKQSILILLNTRVGERLHHPDFGSGLSDYIFESMDAESLADLKEDIAKAIILHEKRVQLNEVLFDTQDLYEGLLNITLNYTILNTHQSDSLVLPFYLNTSE